MFNFTRSELITILSSSNQYEENEFFFKYIDLILENKNQDYIKYHTQRHHFIPVRHYWEEHDRYNRQEALRLADSDTNNFKVNLLYKNHVLAHYYLSLCAKTNFAIWINSSAVANVLRNNLYKKMEYYPEEKELLLQLDFLQDSYTRNASAYFSNLTVEQKLEISRKHSVIQKRVAQETTAEQMEQMNTKRRASWNKHSEEQKQKYSESKRSLTNEQWANRTPEERERIRQKIIATKKARSEELKRRDVEKQIASFHNHTPEELEERRQKKKRYWASLSAEEKALRSQKIWETRRRKAKELNNEK